MYLMISTSALGHRIFTGGPSARVPLHPGERSSCPCEGPAGRLLEGQRSREICPASLLDLASRTSCYHRRLQGHQLGRITRTSAKDTARHSGATRLRLRHHPIGPKQDSNCTTTGRGVEPLTVRPWFGKGSAVVRLNFVVPN